MAPFKSHNNSGNFRATHCTLRVFENKVLQRIFRPRRGDLTEELKKLHEELHNLFSTSGRMIRVGHTAHMGRKECM
jgi:hypothetical protein